MSTEQLSEHRCFGGRQLQYRHTSQTLNCDMNFSVYLPPQAERERVPALYWLSGLTCTDENFVTKAGAQQFAAQYGLAIIAPDTSPRGDDVPDDPDDAYDFGLGAGFYVNATQPPWDRHYHMYDYVVGELPEVVAELAQTDPDRTAISGHSMGGHGALTIALKNPERYRSVSAFAPIASPTNCPWGRKALGNYLGEDESGWVEYDASKLIRTADVRIPMRIDQGTSDAFLEEQLKPELLQNAAAESGYPVDVRMQRGYDHSYFFIASFIGEHLAFHASHV